MKALILYRSYYGNTRHGAELLAGELGELGHQAEVRDLRWRLPDLKDIDCVLIGTPTRMGRASWKARRALRRLRRKGLGAKPLAIFDTYGPVPADPLKHKEDEKWFLPGACGMLQKLAQKLGLNVYPDMLRCQVAEWKGPLKEGENENIACFARAFADAVGK